MSLTDEEKKLIGGSDVAALAELSPYKKPIDVFRRIKLGEEDAAQSTAARRGTLMEPVIRELVRQDFGLTLLGPRKLRDPKRPYVRVSLDDVSKEGDVEVVNEFKSVSPYAAGDYGPSESDVFPEWHLCQLQFYLAETGAPRGRLSALIGVDDLRQYIIKADVDLQGMLFEVVDRFHRDHILTGKPPAVDGSKSFSNYLAKRFPKPKGDMVQAPPEAEELAREFRAASTASDAAKERRDRAKNRLKEIIGENRGLTFANGDRITWGHVNGKPKLDLDALCKKYSITKEALAAHTARGAGHRAFRPSWKEDDDGQRE